jgi:cell division protein FtsB
MVREVTGEQLGSALRKLAEDLVIERRRVARLERENRELRAELEALKQPDGEHELVTRGRSIRNA